MKLKKLKRRYNLFIKNEEKKINSRQRGFPKTAESTGAFKISAQ